MSTFNVIISTIGRPSLLNQLTVLLPQLKEDDCLTIVFDGVNRQELPILKQFVCPVDIYSEPVALGYWGHAVRNKYSQIMRQRDFVLHADDDDQYTEDAIAYLRSVCIDIQALYICKIKLADGEIIPKEQKIRASNIATPCGIVPWYVNKDKRVLWGYLYGGDCHFYHYAQQVAKKLVFLDKLIYIVRPKGE